MNDIILKNIFNEILEISSKNIQEELWLGKNPNKSSSYTEVMCRLFDDNNFTHFVNTGALDIGFSFETLQKIKQLHSSLENYTELDNDEGIINDPKWTRIRQIAVEVVNLWRQDEMNSKLKFKLL